LEDTNSETCIGRMYEGGLGVARDYQQAKNWYQKAVDQGDATAEYLMGMLYENGEINVNDSGVTLKSYKGIYSGESMKWFLKAAAHGDADGDIAVGVHYEMGEGVKVNLPKAVKWYKKAAALGNSQAYQIMGDIYHAGKGVPKDDRKAIEWYQKAISGGRPWVQASIDEINNQKVK